MNDDVSRRGALREKRMGASQYLYKVDVDAVEVPVGFTSVTVTDVSDCTLPVTVNGIVKLNWLPNAVDAEL